jgi:hypothetical protein
MKATPEGVRMNFKLPLPTWQSLDDVCMRWKARQQDILKFAANGQLQLYAFIKPYSRVFFRLDGRSTEWMSTTPVVVSPEVAGRLICETYVNVDEWTTKDSARWERGSGPSAALQGLHITASSLVIFTDELKRFEAEHAESTQPDICPTSLAVGISDSERDKLLRQIAGLALLVAEQNSTYRRGGAPNADKIAKEVGELFDALEDSNSFGAGNTSVRISIAAGLKLLKK